MYHSLFVLLYYVVVYFFPAFTAYFDLPFKKGKRWLCLITCFVIQMIPAIISIFLNVFQTGKEPTPWWFYIGQVLCLIPLLLWCKGNVFLNWLDYFAVGYLGNIFFQFPIGSISAIFFKDPHPIRYESELSSLPYMIPFIIVDLLCSLSTIYCRSLFQKIIRRKWLANTLSILYIFPLAVIGFWTIIPHSGFRAELHLWNVLLAILTYPLFFAALHGIHLLVSTYRTRQSMKKMETESMHLFHQYESITDLTKEASFIRHDIRNHLSVLKSLPGQLDKEDARKMESFLDNTDLILNATDSIKTKEYTDSPILNSLFSIKADEAANNQIELILSLGLPDRNPLSDYEMVSLFSNLLDNALEASLQVPEGSRRITFMVYTRSEYLCIDSKNAYSPTAAPVSGNFRSTKKIAPEEHGFGMQIIHSIVRKHKGVEEMKEGGVSAALPQSGDYPILDIFITIPLS